MAKKTYQIQVALIGVKPKIWRRLLIPSNLLLSDLHKVIQTAMGWTNSHLHQFIKNQTYYLMRWPDDETWEDLNNVDYKKMKISDLLKKEKDNIVYEYDFGDSWNHDVILEKILPYNEKFEFPVCLAGGRHCPPEDCGSVSGYSNLLEIIKQPDNEEYESSIIWLGSEFHPEHFNMDYVNVMLRTKDFGCIELYD